jgi:hypothetical protein
MTHSTPRRSNSHHSPTCEVSYICFPVLANTGVVDVSSFSFKMVAVIVTPILGLVKQTPDSCIARTQ